jgi:hypothetical protein
LLQNKRAKLKKAALQRTPTNNNTLPATNVTPNAYQLMSLYSRLGFPQLKQQQAN